MPPKAAAPKANQRQTPPPEGGGAREEDDPTLTSFFFGWVLKPPISHWLTALDWWFERRPSQTTSQPLAKYP